MSSRSRRWTTGIVTLGVTALLLGCSDIEEVLERHDDRYVSIVDRARYYDVRIDYEEAERDGVSARDVGREYGRRIIDTGVPIEPLLDGFVAEVTTIMTDVGVVSDPHQAIREVEAVKPQIAPRYRDEIEGIASQFGGGANDVPGDGLLSVNELYFVNLVGDLFRTQCSGITVYGERSAGGMPMTAYLNDFPGGAQLSQLHAVATIKDRHRAVVLVGTLGLLNASTTINDDGVIINGLSSEVPGAFRLPGAHAVLFEMRAAAERGRTLSEVAAAIADERVRYAQGFTLSLADPRGGAFLEIDTLGVRALRDDRSELRPGMRPWPFEDAVIGVNSFVLPENSDNHSGDPINFRRWDSYVQQLHAAGSKVSWEELKRIVSFDNGDGPAELLAGTGDIYNQWTLAIIAFRPTDRHLEAYFRPRGAELQAEDPDFITVPLDFD